MNDNKVVSSADYVAKDVEYEKAQGRFKYSYFWCKHI